MDDCDKCKRNEFHEHNDGTDCKVFSLPFIKTGDHMIAPKNAKKSTKKTENFNRVIKALQGFVEYKHGLLDIRRIKHLRSKAIKAEILIRSIKGTILDDAIGRKDN